MFVAYRNNDYDNDVDDDNDADNKIYVYNDHNISWMYVTISI